MDIEKLWNGWISDFFIKFWLPIVLLLYNRGCAIADNKNKLKTAQFDALREATEKTETAKMSDSQAALAIMSAANEKSQDRNVTLGAENLRLTTENAVIKSEVSHSLEHGTEMLQANETLKAELETALKNKSNDLIDLIPCIVWTALPDGKLDYYSKRWYDYTGLSKDQTFGWGWDKAIHPDDLQPTLLAWRASLATGNDYCVLYRFKRMSDGADRWYQGRAQAIRENGVIVKWVGCSMDVHELHLSKLQPVKCELGQSKRVLFADDEATMLTIMRLQLEHGGYEVVTAGDGRVAFDEYSKAKNDGRPFDLLLLDYHMPYLNGEDVARCVRETDQGTSIMFFVAAPEDLTPGIRDELGLSDILPKSVDSEALLRAVRKAIAT